jgi:hypothetical protein
VHLDKKGKKTMFNKLVMAVIAACIFTVSITIAQAEKLQKKSSPPQGEVEVTLMPGWIVSPTEKMNRANSHFCSDGMQMYMAKILSSAFQNQIPPLTKIAYYNIATNLGYSSKDPADRDDIIEKIQPIVDKDILTMTGMLKKGNYFLFVGDLGQSLVLPDFSMQSIMSGVGSVILLPEVWNNQGRNEIYDWATNSFKVYGGDSLKFSTIKATSKEWKEKWQPMLGHENWENIAGRILMDSKLHEVLAEIFDKKTGKTLVKWGAKGINVDQVSALIKDTPAAEYNFDQCGNLNPAYFTVGGQTNN